MRVRRGYVIAFFLCFLAASLCGEDLLSGNFWWEREPFVSGIEYPQTADEALTFLLEEARWVFSGMIYGFSFRYIPADSARNIRTYFELKLLGEIPWGDPALRVISVWPERSRYAADLAYGLSGRTAYYREAWNSNVYQTAAGMGRAPVFEGFSARRRAMEEAIKTAVHGHFRGRSAARPREIIGEVVFQDVPYLIIQDGQYVARVKLRINLELIPEKVY